MIRAVIVAATIAALIALWNDRNPPSRMVQVDYCPITVRGAAKDEQGNWQFGWAEIYGTKTHRGIMDKINWSLTGAVVLMVALIVFMYSVDFKPA